MAVNAVTGNRGVVVPAAGAPSVYIRSGLGFLLAAVLLLLLRWPEILASYRHNPLTLAVTHLYVLGFGTTVTLGALVQLVPVLVGEGLHLQRSARLGYMHLIPGVAVLSGGFALWSGSMIAVGGSLVVAGLLIFTVTFGRALWFSQRRETPRLFILAAMGYLLATALFGMLMAVQLHWPFWSALTVQGLPVHVLLGTVGWFTMMIIGVSYKLFPMFMASPSRLGIRPQWTFALLNAGLIIVLVSWPVDWTWGIALGSVALLTGVAAYLADMFGIFRSRLRRRLGAAMTQGVVAQGYLGVALAAGMALAAWSRWGGGGGPVPIPSDYVMAVGLLFGLGWIGGMIMGMLGRIVPMLVWMDRFAHRAGDPQVPAIPDLLNEGATWVGAGLYHAGLPLLVVSLAIDWSPGIGTGVALLVAGLMLNGGALAWVWHYREESAAVGRV